MVEKLTKQQMKELTACNAREITSILKTIAKQILPKQIPLKLRESMLRDPNLETIARYTAVKQIKENEKQVHGETIVSSQGELYDLVARAYVLGYLARHNEY